ncbi:hypothetical protein E2C01_050963 [Portunus trituberculatus]|uniref:Uncharacterized protein n=1 Tax=Portunus trituberculatus TaxID=210409 RepID=A0A5B7GHV8_PORTR|nr:hypothetical protein [Portunus trituberculatus]
MKKNVSSVSIFGLRAPYLAFTTAICLMWCCGRLFTARLDGHLARRDPSLMLRLSALLFFPPLITTSLNP